MESSLKDEKDVRKRERLQCLYWHKTGQAKSRQALGQLLNRSQFAIDQWVNIYRRNGLHSLLHLNYQGGNLAPSIPLEIQSQLKEKLAQPEGMVSYKAIQIWLRGCTATQLLNFYSQTASAINALFLQSRRKINRLEAT